jgi:hypothetical protein
MAKMHEIVMERFAPIFEQVPDTPDDVYYDANQCAEIINKTLMAGGLYDKGWRCEVDEGRSVVSTETSKQRIFLPPNTKRNSSELKRLIIHEQEVHARRGQNGLETGVVPLAHGTANYGDVEEGEGVLLECIIAGNFDNPSFNRARDRYMVAGLALGVDGAPERDAHQVEYVMTLILALRAAESGGDMDIDKAKSNAYVHVENAFRGTPFYLRGTIYRKLKVYWEGLEKNAQHFVDHIDSLDDMLNDDSRGKYNHTDTEETAKVNAILDRGKKKV